MYYLLLFLLYNIRKSHAKFTLLNIYFAQKGGFGFKELFILSSVMIICWPSRLCMERVQLQIRLNTRAGV